MEFNRRIASVFRFTAITLAIAGLYIILQELEVNWIGPLAMRSDWYQSSQESQWAREAEQLPRPDAASKATWPRHSRRLVWFSGISSGKAARILGSALNSRHEKREEIQALAAEMARTAAAMLKMGAGINPAPPLSFQTPADANSLEERIERDENGMAALISRRFSAQHGYLYKLGMLVGRDDFIASEHGGKFLSPDYKLIGRNATLAGLPRELWYPLTQNAAQSGIPPGQLAAHHEGLIKRIDAYLAAQD